MDCGATDEAYAAHGRNLMHVQSFLGADNNQDSSISFAAHRGVPQQLSNR